MSLKTIGMIISVSIIFTGCAKPIGSERLIPKQLKERYLINTGPLYQSISVNKIGGANETDQMTLDPEIANSELRKAVEGSLQRGGYLSTSKENSKYTLDVYLIELILPKSGFTVTAKVFVRYKLTNNESKQIVYDQILSSADTKGVSDTFFNWNRQTILQEEVMKKNMRLLLVNLSRLNNQLKSEEL